MISQQIERRLDQCEAALLPKVRAPVVFYQGSDPEKNAALYQDNECTEPFGPAELEAMHERGPIVSLPSNGRNQANESGTAYVLPMKDQGEEAPSGADVPGA